MLKIYGIKNCDTMKKARLWLAEHDLEYAFHDYKKDGLSPELAQSFIQELGYEALINKRGTTWRALSQEQKDQLDADSALALMLANPSIIKRPLLDMGSQKLLGFSAELYQANLLA